MKPQPPGTSRALSRITADHCRWLPGRFTLPLALAALLSSPAVLAEQSVASGTNATRASASVDFRIVIPETVRFIQGQEERDRTRQYTSRTVEVVAGQQRVTVARP